MTMRKVQPKTTKKKQVRWFARKKERKNEDVENEREVDTT